MLRLQRKTLRIRNVCRIAAIALFALGSGPVWSQNLTIQQPVVEQFSVGTTVSVPDRGGIILGGVHRAGASRKSFGFSRPGTNTGTFSQGSSTSVHVWIHDFEEMDRAVLEAAELQSSRSSHLRYGAVSPLRPEVAHAAAVLKKRHAEHRVTPPSSRLNSSRYEPAKGSVGLSLKRRK
ncbi:MAG: hypothetical protein O2955_08140 [Planctomycetota bacterium]|nr:hypothetical protein [Planctomycetota bacterium]MDA1212472.1 hypothetical protein [Planctomycetota bacterium]